MKKNEYSIYVDDKTGENYVVIQDPNTKFSFSKAKTIANKYFRTKKENLIAGYAHTCITSTTHIKKLIFWREYKIAKDIPFYDDIHSLETANCIVVAKRRK